MSNAMEVHFGLSKLDRLRRRHHGEIILDEVTVPPCDPQFARGSRIKRRYAGMPDEHFVMKRLHERNLCR